ncbi:MAG: polysaccharide biosynthesis tyrosine autokinase, partial [Hyphomicrobiales bacterium]|nr:polysaccharide biosynthesis tyrosine autokinase [Hyphomicrobiales bacterium]
LNLVEEEDFLAPPATFSLRNLVRKALGRAEAPSVMKLPAETREAIATGTVRGGLSARILRNTRVITLSYSHANPKYAALVANQAAQSFIDQSVDSKSETSSLARQFIQEQVIEIKGKLETSEKALVNYAKTAGITVTGNDGSLISENISQINAALSKAIDDRLVAERYLLQVRDGEASALPQVFASTAVQETKNRITELKATYQEKLAALKPGYPEMRRLKAQINELTKQMQGEISAIARSVEIHHQQTLDKEKALRLELAQLERQQAGFQEKYINYTILKRDVDSYRSQYESLIKKLNEVGIGSDLRTAGASVIDTALVPGGPYTPRLSINLIASIGLFAALAAALIYILELLNNTFASPDQVENELKLPVLGILPDTPSNELFAALSDEKSSLSEAYRTLRTSLQFTGTESSIKTLLVTSSEPGEGKSTSAYKLAQDFAALDRKVLVIDADLRRPQMHRIFRTENGIGLSNLLTNVVVEGSVNEILQETDNPRITLLSAGTIPPNPSDLLVSERMGLALHYCAKKYDMVIVDTPPIMGLSDTPILARQADAVLLLVSSKQVPRKAAKVALKRLKAVGANVVGAAMTKFSISKVDYDYAYRYMGYNYLEYSGQAGKLENHVKAGGAPGSSSSSSSFAIIGGMLGRFARRFG